MGTVTHLAGRRLYLDANVLIYALEDVTDFGETPRRIMRAIDAGHCTGVTSELTLGECLVKPFALGRADIVQAYLTTLSPHPHFQVVPVQRNILIEAARFRADIGIKLAAAIHVATATSARCNTLLTNDRRLRAVPGLEVLLLSEVAGA